MTVFLLDLQRTARRGRPALLRVVYALALLAALGGLFVRTFPTALTFDPQVVARESGAALMARFARHYAAVCAIVQLGAVLLLTPAATAGAIAEERQRGTLDLLLTSDLSATEIVLGKLAARTLHLFALLLTGLPVLALTQLWGGVEPGFVFASFAVNILTLASLGALGLLCSTQARSVPVAATTAYVIALGIGLGTALIPVLRFVNPIILYNEWLTTAHGVGDNWLGPVAAYALFHLTVGVLLVIAAARSLRERLLDVEKVVRAAAARWQPTGLSGDLAALAQAAAPLLGQPVNSLMPRASAVRVFPPPPIGRDPLLWKELHFGGSVTAGELLRSVGCLMLLLGILAFLPVVLLLAHPSQSPSVARELNPFFVSLVVALSCVLCLGAAVSAAGSVSREREQHTLDGLLTLPGGRVAVLEAKWLGSLLRIRWLAAGQLPALGLVLLSEGLALEAIPYLVVTVLVHVGFCASLGVCVSVWARGTGRAAVLVVGILITLSVVPMLASGTVAGLAAPYVRLPAVQIATHVEESLSPPLTWRRLVCDEVQWQRLLAEGRLTAMLPGVLGYAVAAVLLLGLAHWRFGHDGPWEPRP